VPERLGSAHRVIAPYQAFTTADGHVVLGATTPAAWQALRAIIGTERLPEDDARWRDAASRRAHAVELAAIIEAVTKTRTTETWIATLEAARIPCGRLNDYAHVFADPHLEARGLFVDLPHPVLGTVPAIGSPVHMSGTPPVMRSAAPGLGEHTRAVLGEAGLSSGDIDGLFASGAAR